MSGRWDEDTPQANVVELRVDPTLQASGTLPDTLNDIAYFDREDATQIRTISLDMEVRGGTRENMDLFGDQWASDGYELSSMNGSIKVKLKYGV